jgi:hypothetical protein
MAITSTVIARRGAMQFRSLFEHVAEVEVHWDPDSVNSNSSYHEDVTVQGAELGDICWASVRADVQDLDLVAHVTADDVVTLGLHNPTAGAVDLGEVHTHVIVLRPTHRG